MKILKKRLKKNWFSIQTQRIRHFFILVVVNLSPWYEPRYFIPIAGMIIGNSMTGISLGVKSS
ncbi:ABC transporter permease [Thermovorax subterraneus]|nr:ABC transporter permease [Thermovorax subterraneus]